MKHSWHSLHTQTGFSVLLLQQFPSAGSNMSTSQKMILLLKLNEVFQGLWISWKMYQPNLRTGLFSENKNVDFLKICGSHRTKLQTSSQIRCIGADVEHKKEVKASTAETCHILQQLYTSRDIKWLDLWLKMWCYKSKSHIFAKET